MLVHLVTIGLLLAVVGADQYSVPDPNIECFSPKGLRVSIPDAPDIKSVQFFLSFNRPINDNDPGTVSKEIDDKQGSYWIYWNPGVKLGINDVVNFKLMVNNRDLYWSKQGSHVVDRLISLVDNSVITADCEDEAGQQQTAVFPNLDSIEDKALTLTGGQNGLKPSYSMFKTLDSKPITRSTTTTTSGTYYIKPSGDIEGNGYRASSSYDSTRRDGEQWQHSKSDLTGSDLDDFQRIHGQNLLGLPSFGGGAHTTGGGSHSSYSSYSSSSSSSSQSRPAFGSSSSYFQTGQTADAIPVVRPSGAIKYSEYEERHTSQSNPSLYLPAAKFSSSSSSDFVRTPVGSPVVNTNTEYVQVAGPVPSGSTGYTTVQKNYHKKETVKTSGPVITSIPSAGTTVQKETYEFSSAPAKTVVHPYSVQPLSLTETTVYQGDVFRSSVRPTTPNSCQIADYGYKTPDQVDVVELDRSIQKIQCLAVLAESNVKAEIRSLKAVNADLVGRLENLEEQFRRFRDNCRCG